MYEAGSNLSLAPFAHGLVGYWSFDAGSGSTVADGSGYGNTGLWNGTGTVHWVAGKVGASAGQFNGTNDYVGSITIGQRITRGTLVFWVNPNFSPINIPTTGSPAGWAYIGDGTCVTPMARTTSNDWQFGIHASPGYDFPTVPASQALTQNQWSQEAVTFDFPGSVARYYSNGSELTSISPHTLTAGEVALGQNNILRIGMADNACWSGQFWNGLIDDVRVYSRALSAAEISAMYNASK